MINQIVSLFWRPIEHYGPRIPELIITLVLGIVVIKIVSYFLAQTVRLAKIPKALSVILSSVISIILWVLLFSEFFRQAGLTNLALTISGGTVVIGLILANALAPVIADIASGVYLAKDPDFEIGYLVKIGDVEGIIRKIDIRKVRIRDEKGKLHVFPNSIVDKGSWEVLSRDPEADINSKEQTTAKKSN